MGSSTAEWTLCVQRENERMNEWNMCRWMKLALCTRHTAIMAVYEWKFTSRTLFVLLWWILSAESEFRCRLGRCKIIEIWIHFIANFIFKNFLAVKYSKSFWPLNFSTKPSIFSNHFLVSNFKFSRTSTPIHQKRFFLTFSSLHYN